MNSEHTYLSDINMSILNTQKLGQVKNKSIKMNRCKVSDTVGSQNNQTIIRIVLSLVRYFVYRYRKTTPSEIVNYFKVMIYF